VHFFERILVHTKGDWARRPFLLAPWQRDEIIVPLFGRVEWSPERRRWVRTYRIAWIELGRKNGKSEMLAGIALILLVGDDEESAEVYGAARDRDQARVVFDVAQRMVELSPVLSRRLRTYRQTKRIVDDRTGSYYQVLAADAAGNLGLNPHGIIVDEVLTQPDDSLWNALRTGMGARSQPLMIGATTASDDPMSFATSEHTYSERVMHRPLLDPRRLVYMKTTPLDADPWDERVWHMANPALGDFLSVETLRQEALEAKNEPAKEHSFRQFRLNQWLSLAVRWMPEHTWAATSGPCAATPAEAEAPLLKQRCFGGFDLSAKYDLTSLCWVFPSPAGLRAIWRFWVPEEQVDVLDRLTGGHLRPWVEQGWITATPGAVIDYDEFYAQLDADRQRFKVVDVNHDPAMAAPVVQELEKRGFLAVQVAQGFAMSEPLQEVMRLVKAKQLFHAGNPVAEWNVLSADVKQDDRERLRLIKPRRGATGKRIDGAVALVMAVDGLMRRGSVAPPRRMVAGF
jgi:phage terminase large subunit-like protein